MTVFVYVNTVKQVGDVDRIKVFSTLDAAEKWFEENDPGVNRIAVRLARRKLTGVRPRR